MLRIRAPQSSPNLADVVVPGNGRGKRRARERGEIAVKDIGAVHADTAESQI